MLLRKSSVLRRNSLLLVLCQSDAFELLKECPMIRMILKGVSVRHSESMHQSCGLAIKNYGDRIRCN